MHPINQTTIIQDTYYVEQNRSNAKNRVNLAIQPMINCEAKLISWQDSTMHAKSLPFKLVEIDDTTKEIKIIDNDGNEYHLKLLTIDIFKRSIGTSSVGDDALLSDESLRDWYLESIR